MKSTLQILSASFLMISLSAFAQERSMNWIQNLGGSEVEEATCVLPTSDGGLLVSGYSYSKDGLVSSNKGFQDGWLIKTNAEGYLEWEKNFGGDGGDVIEEVKEVKDGFVICGWSSSTTPDFVESKGLEDGFIAKTNKAGDIIWKRSFGGSLMDKLFDIEILDNGDIVAVGYLMSPEVTLASTVHKGLLDVWVIRLNAKGQLIWQNCYGGSDDDFAYNICKSADNNLIIAGSSDSMDGLVGITEGEWDGWLIQLDLNGQVEWSNKFGHEQNEIVNDLILYNNNYYIIGSSNSSNRPAAHGNYDAWIVQVDTRGNYINEFSFGSSGKDIVNSAVAAEDGIYISGESQSDDSGDGWLMQIDGNGEIIFSQLIGGSESDILRDIAIKDDNLFIAGSSYSSDGDMLQNFGESDLLLAKLGDDQLSESVELKLFPNPATDQITIVLDKIGIEQITIYNSLGQVVKSLTANDFFQEQISVSDWDNGIYTIQVLSNNDLVQQQFVKL